jgi:hypothetical protein
MGTDVDIAWNVLGVSRPSCPMCNCLLLLDFTDANISCTTRGVGKCCMIPRIALSGLFQSPFALTTTSCATGCVVNAEDSAIQDRVYALTCRNNSISAMSTCIIWIRIQHPGALHMERMNSVVAPSLLYWFEQAPNVIIVFTLIVVAWCVN